MKFQIFNRWSGNVQFECELEAKYESENYYFQLGAAVKIAFKSGASLDGARLDGASLVGASLDGARLVGASLVGARLDGASLVGASLDGARLDGASLVGASLVGARLDGASLVGASLDGARLDGARLDGASLVGARLDGARGEALKLVGERPIMWFGPVGSVSRTVYSFLTDRGVYVRAGCFWNTLERFKAQVAEVHGDSVNALEYRAAITLMECHATLWPAKGGK